jgi:hypothetical protein
MLFFAACSPVIGQLDAGGEPDASVVTDAGEDAGASSDAGPQVDAGSDAGSPPDAGADAGVPCGALSSATHFVCAADGNSRLECASNQLVTEPCSRGCLRNPSTADSVCLGSTNAFTCSGSYGTQRASDGDYYLTAFGCWLDATGGVHTDPADNCIPSCLSQARAAGLCAAGDTGPACEEKITWFTADGARFGCLQRLRVTNPANGKAVIAVALDYGPGCPGENSVGKTVLDASGRVDRYLFGSDQGTVDHALVHVVEVDNATPLGPVP